MMKIRHDMCSFGAIWFHFSCKLDSIFVLVTLECGGGVGYESHSSFRVSLLHVQAELPEAPIHVG